MARQGTGPAQDGLEVTLNAIKHFRHLLAAMQNCTREELDQQEGGLRPLVQGTYRALEKALNNTGVASVLLTLSLGSSHTCI